MRTWQALVTASLIGTERAEVPASAVPGLPIPADVGRAYAGPDDTGPDNTGPDNTGPDDPAALRAVLEAIRSVPGARYFGVVPPKLAQSANWLEGFLEPILADDRVIRNTLVVVTFDESLSDDNNHIYTVFLGDMVRPGARVDGCYDHYDLLRTIEENFGLGTLGAEDAKSDPIVEGVRQDARQ